MTTPLIMIAILTGPFLLARLLRPEKAQLAAIAGASALFVFTGIGHFVKTSGMASMLPAWTPCPTLIVYATGIIEFALATLLLIPNTRSMASRFAIVLLALFLPVNIYAAFQQANMGGHAWGPAYLIIRIPLQIAIAVWIYWLSIRSPSFPPPNTLSLSLSQSGPARFPNHL